jgi:hypothetical protein
MSTPLTSRFTVKRALTPNRRTQSRRYTENTDYAAFVTRILRAHGKRVADGDVAALSELVALSTELDAAITTGITGLRAHGHSWADIAIGLGVTRQAAQQRWGKTA